MILVEVTNREVAFAAFQTIFRECVKNGSRQENGPTNWDNAINGAVAELAWAKKRNLYWSGISGVRAPDTSGGEVRWTHHKDTGGLVYYDHDDDKHIYVLADQYPPIIRFVGWLPGSEAREKRVKNGNIYIVPRELVTKFGVEK